MNINRIRLLYSIIIIMGFNGCTLSQPDDNLFAYLFNVIDSYPLKRTNSDADSVTDRRTVQFRYQLRNDTKQVFWLKLTKYDGLDNKDTASLISFSVNHNDKSICVDPYDQNKSIIFPRHGKEIDYTENRFYPGDSACVIIDIPEYILDSLGIDKLTSAIDISNMISFESYHQIESYEGYKVPHIKLINSNRLGIVSNVIRAKWVDKRYDIYNDSINNVTYAFPFFWKVPIVNYVNDKN